MRLLDQLTTTGGRIKRLSESLGIDPELARQVLCCDESPLLEERRCSADEISHGLHLGLLLVIHVCQYLDRMAHQTQDRLLSHNGDVPIDDVDLRVRDFVDRIGQQTDRDARKRDECALRRVDKASVRRV